MCLPHPFRWEPNVLDPLGLSSKMEVRYADLGDLGVLGENYRARIEINVDESLIHKNLRVQ